MAAYKKRGFSIGIGLFLLMMLSPAPSGLSDTGWDVAAVAVLMAIWWATETVPVAVTALLPLALFPLLGVSSFEDTALPYANKNIYLFLGGFMLALGIESSGLHKRIALKMIIVVGSSGRTLVGGFMLVAALISMWVMNTSTTLMLLPIGLAVCGVISETIPNASEKDKSNFDTALLLGIAYAATIGGMSTLIGTAPNIVFSAFMQDTYGVEISMFDWMMLGVPLASIMLFGAWVLLTKYVFPINFVASNEARNELKTMLSNMGDFTKDEKRISVIFGLAVFAWVFRSLLNNIDFLAGLTDAGIAIIAAIIAIPASVKPERKSILFSSVRNTQAKTANPKITEILFSSFVKVPILANIDFNSFRASLVAIKLIGNTYFVNSIHAPNNIIVANGTPNIIQSNIEISTP